MKVTEKKYKEYSANIGNPGLHWVWQGYVVDVDLVHARKRLVAWKKANFDNAHTLHISIDGLDRIRTNKKPGVYPI